MGRETHQVDLQRFDIDGQPAHRLRGVGVQQHPPLAAQRTDFRQRLQYPDLVVGKHDRDQDRAVAHGVGHLAHIQLACIGAALLGHWQQGYLAVAPGQTSKRVQNGTMLGGHADDVVPLAVRPFGNAAHARDCCSPSRRW